MLKMHFLFGLIEYLFFFSFLQNALTCLILMLNDNACDNTFYFLTFVNHGICSNLESYESLIEV